MQFSEYQRLSRVTATYPHAGDNFIYPTLGLAGEAGEVVDKIKKLQRDYNIHTAAQVTEERRVDIEKEMGDVVWYLAQLATELNINFDDVAVKNLEKLLSRLERNTLGGEGDNR